MRGLKRLSRAALLVFCALWSTAARAGGRAEAILERHQCHRCHEVPGVAPPPKERHCAGCHQEISSAAGDPARMRAGREEFGRHWDRFVARTGGLYCHVPPLAGMDRFRADWLTAFLASPYDLRPHLTESMIRHNLSDEEIAALVSAGSARPPPRDADPPPAAEQLERGAALFEQKGCGACHLFGNRPLRTAGASQFTPAPKVRLRALAPDLRHARDRLTREVIVSLLRDPRSVNPSAEMPKLPLTEEEVALLADFVLYGDFGPPRAHAPPSPPPYDAKARVPTYAEVEREVFRKVCWHCHSDPDFNWGDGGPGNTGGFGFPGAGLSFANWEAVMSGSVAPDGKRRSILRPGVTGEPVLLERLRLRYAENARDHLPPGGDDLKDRRAPRSDLPRGMPLGLPALTPEQFSLVERWVKGGAPGP